MTVSSSQRRLSFRRNCLIALSILLTAPYLRTPRAAMLETDGKFVEFALPNQNSGPTTVSVAKDGSLWFTESSGNRIGRMNADGSGYQGFTLPNANSGPRIIALGADGNMWFSEHTGNRMGRISPKGELAEFEIPTPASQPRAIALGSDGNI